MPFLFLLIPLIGAILGDRSNRRSDEDIEETTSETSVERRRRRILSGYDPIENKTWVLEQKWKITID